MGRGKEDIIASFNLELMIISEPFPKRFDEGGLGG